MQLANSQCQLATASQCKAQKAFEECSWACDCHAASPTTGVSSERQKACDSSVPHALPQVLFQEIFCLPQSVRLGALPVPTVHCHLQHCCKLTLRSSTRTQS